MKNKKNPDLSKNEQEELKNEDLNSKVEELEEKVASLEHARLIALADYQNLQKRNERDREELSYVLSASLLNSIIDVKEDLERHLTNIEDEALKAITDKLRGILNERGVEEMEVNKGDNFDPSSMEAITTIPVQDEKDINKVIDITQKGYKLNTGRIVRTTKVVVGKAG